MHSIYEWASDRKSGLACAAVIATCFYTTSALAGFDPYIIRGAATINDLGGGVTEIVIDVGGEKAALGSNDINGATLGSITSLKITRVDDRTRYSVGSGPYVAPYLNFWITDGTNYAVVANEPSDANFQSLYNNGYDLDFADLADKAAKIYEKTDKSWLPNNGVGLTFADLAGFVIAAPTVAELNTGWPGLGTGAPRELGTNIAYGVNWVFGDTLSNYVSDQTGYQVRDASVAAEVPLPATLGLLLSALVGFGIVNRRRDD